MKIKKISIRNLIGLRSIDLECEKPITLVCGPNGSGKSSLVHAMRLALVAEAVRTGPTKADRAALLTEGATKGSVAVAVEGAAPVVVELSASGSISLTGGDDLPSHLAPILDAGRLSRMSISDRRTYLFGLMGTATGAAVRDRLLGRGCDPDLVASLPFRPQTDGGEALQEAEAQRRADKTAWKRLAGTEYGSKKAEGWTAAPAPAPAGADRQETQDCLRKAKDRLAGIQRQIGAGLAGSGRKEQIMGEIKELQAKASSGRTAKVTMAEFIAPALQAVQAEMDRANAIKFVCPDCGVVHSLAMRDGSIKVVSGMELTEEDRRGLLNRHAVISKDAQSATETVAAGAAAEMQIARLLEELAALPEDQRLESLHREAQDLQEKTISLLEKRIRELDDADLSKNDADRRTQEAAGLHARIQAWDAIVEALSPAGIPGEMLRESISPLNVRLTESARLAGWTIPTGDLLQPVIRPDMTITLANGRPYLLLSESEQWRVDALLSDAIAHQAGLRLLVLDGMDVLDLQARAKGLRWLHAMAKGGEYDSVLLFATLKAPPTLPNEFQVVWMGNDLAAAA